MTTQSLGSRRLPRLTLSLAPWVAVILLIIAYPPSWETYADLSSPDAINAVKEHDSARDRGGNAPIGFDHFSYFARATSDGDPYLAGRAPYAHRPLVPAIVRATFPLVAPRSGFRVLAILGVLLQLLAIARLLSDVDCRPILVAGALACLSALPGLALPLRYPLIIDALAWAGVLWGWWAARNSRFLLASLSMALAVLVHEVALVGLFPVLLSLSSNSNKANPRLAWAVTIGLPAIAFALPRMLVETTWRPSLRLLDRIDPALVSITFLPEFLYGLGVASLVSPLLIKDLQKNATATQRQLSYEAASLAVPLLLAVIALPLAIGRLLVLGGAAAAILLALWLDRQQPRIRVLVLAAWILTSLVTAISWSVRSNTAYVAAASALSLLVLILILRPPLTSTRTSATP